MRTPSRNVATSSLSSSRRRGRGGRRRLIIGRTALVPCVVVVLHGLSATEAAVADAYCGALTVQATDPWCQNQCCHNSAVCGWYQDETKSVRISPPATCVPKYWLVDDAWCAAVTCCASAYCEWRYATTTDPPTDGPTKAPTEPPTEVRTHAPTDVPTDAPTTDPPSVRPTTSRPTDGPSTTPTSPPTTPPTSPPSTAPPSPRPSVGPSSRPPPSAEPNPTPAPAAPTPAPVSSSRPSPPPPSDVPTTSATTSSPSSSSSSLPPTPAATTSYPTAAMSSSDPSPSPSSPPSSSQPSVFPTSSPSFPPSDGPTLLRPSRDPSFRPSVTTVPTAVPSAVPTASFAPSVGPSLKPSSIPSGAPSGTPSRVPTANTMMTTTIATRSVTDGDGNAGSETSCVGAGYPPPSPSPGSDDGGGSTTTMTTTVVEVTVTYDYAVLSKVGTNLGSALSKLEGTMLDAVELSCEASSSSSSPGARRRRRRRYLDDVGGNGTSSSSSSSFYPFRASTLPYDAIKTSCDESEESNATDVQCAVVSGGFAATYDSNTSIARDEALQSYLVWVKDRMTDGSFASAMSTNNGIVGLIYRGNDGSGGTGGTGAGVVPDGRDGDGSGPGVSALNRDPEPQDEGGDKLSTWGGVFVATACIGTVLVGAALIRRRRSTEVEVTEDGRESQEEGTDDGYDDDANSRSPLGATPPRNRRYDYSSSYYLENDVEEPSARVVYESHAGDDGLSSTMDGESSSGYDDSTRDALASIIEDVDYSLENSLESTSSGPRTRNSSVDTVPGSLGTVPENEAVTTMSTSDMHSCNSATCQICRDRENVGGSGMPRTQFLHMSEEGMESFEVRWSPPTRSSNARGAGRASSSSSGDCEPNTVEL